MKFAQFRQKLHRAREVIKQDGIAKGARRLITTRPILQRTRAGAIIGVSRLRARNGLIEKTIEGSRMYVDVNDPGISRELLLRGYHERRTTDLVKQELQEGMVVVDIGANIGYYCLLEARLVGSSGRVYAIEPVPKNYDLLCRNIALNDYRNICTHNVAVSSAAGLGKLAVTDASNWGSMLDLNTPDASDHIRTRMQELTRGFVEVRTVSIDEFLEGEQEPDVDFLRMDIEGYEIEALRGMMNTLERSRPPVKLLIEVHNSFFRDLAESLGPILEKLLHLGFLPKVLIAKADVYHDMKPDDLVPTLSCTRR